MKIFTQFAGQATQKALTAYQIQKRFQAKIWARAASLLAPGREEPWLILAAVSNPGFARVCLKKVLKINPSNRKALDGLEWLDKHAVGVQKAKASPHPTQPMRLAPGPDRAFSKQSPSTFSASTPGWIKLAGTLAIASVFSMVLLPGIFLGVGLAFYNGPSGKQAFSFPIQIRSQALTMEPSATPLLTETSTPTQPIPYTATPTLTPTASLTPSPSLTPPQASPTPTMLSGPKHILVVISEERVYAYQGESLVYKFVASTGSGNNTPTGHFTILDKIPKPYSYAYGFWMPAWMGFSWVGGLEDGFHSLPLLSNGSQLWGNSLGTPVSYGCVVLGPADAETLYNWAEVGTGVDIHH